MVNSMNNKKYNVFLLVSNMARNIIDVFSLIILYKEGVSVRNIFLFLNIYYFVSIGVNFVSVKIINKYKYKYLLFLSSIMIGIGFWYLSIMRFNFINLVILAVILAIGNYTYHTVRHYLGIKYVNNRKNVSYSLIFTYIGVMISSYVGAYVTDNFSVMATAVIVSGLSIISIIPVFRIENKDIDNGKDIVNLTKVKLTNTWFMILEQFKVIFLLLEPLFLYIYIDNKLEYIGIFNVVIGISSVIFVYYMGKIKKIDKIFKIINILFVMVLILKLNIKNRYLLFIIAFLEGLGIKNFEISSIENFYHVKQNTCISSYLLLAEIVFCFTSFIICLIFSFINNLVICMYICILFIFICGFIRYKSNYFIKKKIY